MHSVVKNFLFIFSLCICLTTGRNLQASSQKTIKSVPVLSLTGTVIGKAGGNTAVVMDEKKQKQYLLHEGDVIMDAVVRKVERGRAVLFRNGQEEILFLKNRTGKGTPDSTAQRIPVADLMPPPPPPAPAPVTL